MNLETILKNSNSFLQDNHNLQVEKSQLKLYDKKDWDNFCQNSGFSKNSNGIYIPQTKTAYVDISDEFLQTNILHEYFGHGLFFEHSQLADENYENKYFRNEK